MKYFIIAGEPSGDIHASRLIQAVKALDAEAHFAGLGGDRMRDAGCLLYQDYRKMAFMGFAAVAHNLGNILRNFSLAKEALLHEQPDVLILIDYPSFNLRMAAFAKKNMPSLRICYYIPPKVWAWKQFRIHQIARLSDEVLGIFPFEPDFYRSFGYRCDYVGNPTRDEVQEYLQAHPEQRNEAEKPYIAILPGSRPSEISHCLPKMLEAAQRYPEYAVRVAAAPAVDEAFYAKYMDAGIPLVHDTYSLVRGAYAAIVNSGTATLETALLGCPQVAVYHVGCPHLFSLFWWLCFKMRLFTLPNIILGREIIKEKLALHFTVDEVADELERLLHDEPYRRQMCRDYTQLAQTLTPPSEGTSAEVAAEKICRGGKVKK